MRYATVGTILASRLALEHGLAINLGGGFHHAVQTWGGGFRVYADAPVAAKISHDECKISRVLVIDFDAHQGNGTAAVFHEWPWATILDLYELDLFPRARSKRSIRFPCRPA
jgi:histone deacetylase 11